MKTLSKMLKAFWLEESGLTTVEYAIAGGLIGAAVILNFTSLGTAVSGVIGNIDTILRANAPGA